MPQPFDETHVLDLGYKSISVDYDYSVTINALESGSEHRNLNHSRPRYVFSVNWDQTDKEDYELLKEAFDRAKSSFEGFYLRHHFFAEDIPVRFDSPFRWQLQEAAECCDNWWLSIQDLRMVEVEVPNA